MSMPHDLKEGLSLLAGKKLLLVDDSLAVQKVVDLTFSDEGMQVATFSDGQQALDEFAQISPDVVLADVFMPGVDGYQLCSTIKQRQQLRPIPVMLLVGSFEPFDEAEARRVGADDVVTKPFQSIRDLVNRVGSLLSGGGQSPGAEAHEHSTLGLSPEVVTSPVSTESVLITESAPEPKVFVEAAPLHYEEAAEHPSGASCASDVEFQTADTIELEPVHIDSEVPDSHSMPAAEIPPESASPVDLPSVGATPVAETSPGVSGMTDESLSPSARIKNGEVLKDGILDLGDVDGFTSRAVADDFVLDLDYEEPIQETPAATSEPEPASVFESQSAPLEIQVEESEPIVSVVSEPPPTSPASEEPAKISATEGSNELSAEAIDAIAQRVVERLSDQVIREIAWEVVPDLAELLIKKKLEEEK